MISKDEALRATKMSWDEIKAEYPKATMVIEYISKHYPENTQDITSHRMIPFLIFGERSNNEIEDMIDKIAIFNGWIKHEPKP